MATRNLTELFFILQNNTIYNKNIFSEDNGDGDKLLPNSSENINGSSTFIYPDWISKYEDAQYFLTKLKIKIDDLSKLQEKHMRSVLKENSEEETEIEVVSQSITKLITSTHSHIKSINSCATRGKDLEKKLLNNIVKSLSMTLQNLSNKFKDVQNTYIQEINSVEMRSNAMFELLDFNATENDKNATAESFNNFGSSKLKQKTVLDYEDDQIDEFFELPASHNIEQKKMMLMEIENTRMIEDRENDVIKIVKSLIDLNDIFKDLANIVQEQGTILDRIDYNVETTQTKVVEGYKQLKKAEMYQRKNKKVYCILCLASTILILLVLLIFTKF